MFPNPAFENKKIPIIHRFPVWINFHSKKIMALILGVILEIRWDHKIVEFLRIYKRQNYDVETFLILTNCFLTDSSHTFSLESHFMNARVNQKSCGKFQSFRFYSEKSWITNMGLWGDKNTSQFLSIHFQLKLIFNWR